MLFSTRTASGLVERQLQQQLEYQTLPFRLWGGGLVTRTEYIYVRLIQYLDKRPTPCPKDIPCCHCGIRVNGLCWDNIGTVWCIGKPISCLGVPSFSLGLGVIWGWSSSDQCYPRAVPVRDVLVLSWSVAVRDEFKYRSWSVSVRGCSLFTLHTRSDDFFRTARNVSYPLPG